VCLTFFHSHSHLQVRGDDAGEGNDTPANVTTIDWKNQCPAFGGYYRRGIPCCKDKYIQIRFELHYFSAEYGNCLKTISKAPENKEDDLPALLVSNLCQAKLSID